MKRSGKRTVESKDGLDKVEYLYHLDPTMERLKLPAFAVWSALLDLRFEKTPVVSASRRKIMAASGIRSKDTVTRALVELETKGFISRMSSFADDRRTPNYFLYENPERPQAPKPVSPGKTEDWANRPIDFMGLLNIRDLENAVRKAVGMPALPDEGPPSSLAARPSSMGPPPSLGGGDTPVAEPELVGDKSVAPTDQFGGEDGQTGLPDGTDQPMSEDRPDREMVQTSPGNGTDQPARMDRPARERGQAGPGNGAGRSLGGPAMNSGKGDKSDG